MCAQVYSKFILPFKINWYFFRDIKYGPWLKNIANLDLFYSFMMCCGCQLLTCESYKHRYFNLIVKYDFTDCETKKKFTYLFKAGDKLWFFQVSLSEIIIVRVLSKVRSQVHTKVFKSKPVFFSYWQSALCSNWPWH